LKAEQLADLAASVADGAPVDWQAAEHRVSIAERKLIGHLRLVESIANLHRSIPEDRPISDLAASVADGGQVDWRQAERELTPAERRLVRHLQIVQNISTLHRTAGEAGEDGGAAVGITSPDPTPHGPRWGRFVLRDRIGEGMSSEVHRAWDSTLHQEVALKLLHDDGNRRDAHARLLEEARRLARVRHAHVVQVYGAEQHDSRVGLWMELVRGESLEEIVRARGPFGAREASSIGLDLCAALAAVHGARLLHRDIKPHNVMRESGGRIVLMDFGTGEELSGTNRLVGTPLFLAPEIFKGQTASVQSDLYSLGVLLFYLVTGKYPVTAMSMEQLAKAHERRQRKPLRDLRPDLPEGFVRSVERALESDPKQRYQSAGEMEAALRSADAVPATAAAAPPASTPVRKTRMGMGFLAVAAVLAVLVAGLIVWSRATQPGRGTELVSIRSLAVLPISTAAGVTLQPGLREGLTHELISTLGQLHELTVKSGLLLNERDNRSDREIATALDVDALLRTRLSSTAAEDGRPGRLTIYADLIAAGSGGIVRTWKFERPQGQSSGLQTDLAKAIAQAVNVAVTPAESARFSVARQTNPTAEEAYLLGRFHLDQYGAGSAEQALRAFQRALTADPQYAAAHVGAARAHVSLGANGAITHAQARSEGLKEARRALELDAEYAEAHAALAHILFIYDWDWAEAEREFKRSLELNPNSRYARTFYADCLAALGRFDEAVVHAEMAKRLDPQSGVAARQYALVLYYKRDFDGAERALQDALAIEPSGAANPLLQGRVDEARGRFPEALEKTQRAAELSGGGRAPLRIAVIRLEALAGNRQKAIADLTELRREAASRSIRLLPRDLAYVSLALNDTSGALDLFSQAFDDRDPSLVWLGVDPRLDPVRRDPRFHQLLKRIGLPVGP
jgi:tetratricopeptide (TPR) repeat protein/TolB-like protein